jgi:carbonic anhydrase
MDKERRMLRLSGMVRAGLIAGLAMGASTAMMAQQGADWGFEGKKGPLNWGKLDPAYRACSEGKEQSPIDIRGAHKNKQLQPIEFHYISSGMKVENTGHTIRVWPAAGSYILANGVRYDLVEFHFEHPGEEIVKGKTPDMGIHMVHKSADGKVAVIGIRLNEGNANAVLAALWPHLPKTAGATDQMTESMSPAGLIPTNRAYWTYDGSLTAPPCTEGVKWYIFEQQVELSRSQLKAFGELYKVNSRLLQAAHGRKIEAYEP